MQNSQRVNFPTQSLKNTIKSSDAYDIQILVHKIKSTIQQLAPNASCMLPCIICSAQTRKFSSDEGITR